MFGMDKGIIHIRCPGSNHCCKKLHIAHSLSRTQSDSKCKIIWLGIKNTNCNAESRGCSFLKWTGHMNQRGSYSCIFPGHPSPLSKVQTGKLCSCPHSPSRSCMAPHTFYRLASPHTPDSIQGNHWGIYLDNLFPTDRGLLGRMYI
jgi:hypothetical protein